MFQFYALPTWALGPAVTGPAGRVSALKKPSAPQADPLVPALATEGAIVVLALGGAELAGMRAVDRARAALAQSPTRAVFARPPNDLPALLRLADELLRLARQIEGLPPRTWQCSCGTRYSVPAAVLVPMSITCERCGRHIELEPEPEMVGEASDPQLVRVNAYRGALSEFFREAMARGWPVLVRRDGS